MSELLQRKQPVALFCSYAQKDAPYVEELEKQLRLLQRQQYITCWYRRNISAGSEWEHDITTHLDTAQIILLLISPDFFRLGLLLELRDESSSRETRVRRGTGHPYHPAPGFMVPCTIQQIAGTS